MINNMQVIRMADYEGEGHHFREEEDEKEPESPWGIYWGAAMPLNRKFGGKPSSFEKMFSFLDECEADVSAGFSESYVKLLEKDRGMDIKWYRPLQCETSYYFRSSKRPEEIREHIGKLILKTNGILKANEQLVLELEMDGYHRFDFYMKKNFPHRAFGGWVFDHPVPSWF